MAQIRAGAEAEQYASHEQKSGDDRRRMLVWKGIPRLLLSVAMAAQPINKKNLDRSGEASRRKTHHWNHVLCPYRLLLQSPSILVLYLSFMLRLQATSRA